MALIYYLIWICLDSPEQNNLSWLSRGHARRKLSASVLENGPSWVAKLAAAAFGCPTSPPSQRCSRAYGFGNQVYRGRANGPGALINNVYLDEHPLTKLDLQNEVAHLQIIGISLCITTDAQT